MIRLARVRADPFRIECGDDVGRRPSLHPEGNKSLTGRVVRSTDDMDTGKLGQPPAIPGAEQGGVGQGLLVCMDCASRRLC